MRYMVEKNFINVIGRGWYNQKQAYSYNLTALDIDNYDMRNEIKQPTRYMARETFQKWLDRNAGDFQSIDDFYVTVGDEELDWNNEESECDFNDMMYPSEIESLEFTEE